MINKAGKTVQPTIEAFQAAASNADWAKAPGYYVILTDQPGEASWPITAATFILMHKAATDKAASQEAIKFFKWSFEKGGKMAEELDYIPMPELGRQADRKDLERRDQELSSAIRSASAMRAQPGLPGLSIPLPTGAATNNARGQRRAAVSAIVRSDSWVKVNRGLAWQIWRFRAT